MGCREKSEARAEPFLEPLWSPFARGRFGLKPTGPSPAQPDHPAFSISFFLLNPTQPKTESPIPPRQSSPSPSPCCPTSHRPASSPPSSPTPASHIAALCRSSLLPFCCPASFILAQRIQLNCTIGSSLRANCSSTSPPATTSPQGHWFLAPGASLLSKRSSIYSVLAPKPLLDTRPKPLPWGLSSSGTMAIIMTCQDSMPGFDDVHTPARYFFHVFHFCFHWEVHLHFWRFCFLSALSHAP